MLYIYYIYIYLYICLEIEPIIEEINYLRIPDDNLLFFLFRLQTLVDSLKEQSCKLKKH